MRTAVLYNGINSGQEWTKKKTISDNISIIKVHMKGRQRSEIKI